MGDLKGRSLREIAATNAKRMAEREKAKPYDKTEKYRQAYRQGMTIKAIANYYKVSPRLVSQAVKGEQNLQKSAHEGLIRDKYRDGMCAKCLAVEHDVSVTQVYRVCKGIERESEVICNMMHERESSEESERLRSLRTAILRLRDEGLDDRAIALKLDISQAEVVELGE